MAPALSWPCPVATNAILNSRVSFDLPITNIIGDAFNGEEANPTKEAILQKQRLPRRSSS